MLDSQTKQLINSARDILVGKVPDPKSQIEQITLALIYKFMDDMDRETVEKLKGKPKFFAGDFAKYSWRNIFNPTLGGHEMLALYAEALEKMNTNPGIHQFFREIFKNAFLPYRSPETLKLFLKTINEFNYDHSENLGNAYEYLLSILGTQGDAGQFRTPRHIIDFIVKVIDPQKHETILDPACGTAGFLLAAYKHILSVNTNKTTGDNLTPDDRKLLATNLTGYDIDPNMERFALVNMFLHGFVTPQIHEYDTLSSQDRWNEYYDVILANPPFMSPKGGIRPHNRFSVKSNRSEVLFVDYIAEHLAAGGRAGVIVPEGIIFQIGTAYKSLRKILVEENYLVGVISLPAGVFNPYSGVKTSILWLDKTLAKKTDKILFVKITSDGFDLGAQRRSVKENDLTNALLNINAFKQTLLKGEESDFDKISNLSLIEKQQIAKSGEYNLSGERYSRPQIVSSIFPMVNLGEVADVIAGQSPLGENYNEVQEGMPFYQGKTDFGEMFIGEPRKWTTQITKEAYSGDILMSVRAPVGPVNYSTQKICIGRGLAAIRPNEKILSKFLFYLLRSKEKEIIGNGGAVFDSISKNQIEEIQIPLPPLSIQQELVSEIESYQKIIDGARQVVENYKPRIEIDQGWEMVELGTLCKMMTGGTPRSTIKEYYEGGTIKWLVSGDIHKEQIFDCDGRITKIGMESSNTKLLSINSVLIALNGQGKTRGTVALLRTEATCNQSIVAIDPLDRNILIPEFLYFVLKSKYQEIRNITGDNQRSGLNMPILKGIQIPLPDLPTQHRIVDQIEREQLLVRASGELVEVFDGKIRERVKSVWGE